VRIEEQFEVPVGVELAFRALNDVEAIGRCVAGVQDVVVLDEDRSRWTLVVRAGFMALTVTLDASIVERSAPDSISFTATGQDVELSGRIALSAGGTDRSTNCDLVIDAEIGGALGPLADVMARGPQEQLIAETIQNLRQRLGGFAVDEDPASPSGGSAGHSPRPGSPSPRLRVDLPPVPAWRAVGFTLGGLMLGIVLGRRMRA
jgi:carbon monoxide dehydrogenase subunit G